MISSSVNLEVDHGKKGIWHFKRFLVFADFNDLLKIAFKALHLVLVASAIRRALQCGGAVLQRAEQFALVPSSLILLKLATKGFRERLKRSVPRVPRAKDHSTWAMPQSGLGKIVFPKSCLSFFKKKFGKKLLPALATVESVKIRKSRKVAQQASVENDFNIDVTLEGTFFIFCHHFFNSQQKNKKKRNQQIIETAGSAQRQDGSRLDAAVSRDVHVRSVGRSGLTKALNKGFIEPQFLSHFCSSLLFWLGTVSAWDLHVVRFKCCHRPPLLVNVLSGDQIEL